MPDNTRPPISAFIIALNEADRIGKAIAGLRDWVDEVVVIDSGSSDETVALSAGLGARVLHNPWPGYGRQKRFGEASCRNRWVLNVDADERVTPELADEIVRLFRHGHPPDDAYRIRIVDVHPQDGRAPPLAFAYAPIRLYDRGCGRFSESPVHDSVIMATGRVGKLRNGMRHESYRSLSHYVEKVNRYSDQVVAQRDVARERFLALRIFAELPLTFLKSYIGRGHVVDGVRGFVHSVSYAYSRFLRVAKLHEKRRAALSEERARRTR